MSNFKKIISLGVLALAAAALGLGALVFIQPTIAASNTTVQRHGGGPGGCGQAGLDAAAKALNTTTDKLTTQLWGGETLSSLAKAAGVDLKTVQDAVTAACATA